MTSAVPRCLANFEAQRILHVTLVADSLVCDSTAAAINDHNLAAWAAVTNMAQRGAEMTAWEKPLARFVAVGNFVLTRPSRVVHEIFEQGLPTGTMGYHIRGQGAVCW